MPLVSPKSPEDRFAHERSNVRFDLSGNCFLAPDNDFEDQYALDLDDDGNPADWDVVAPEPPVGRSIYLSRPEKDTDAGANVRTANPSSMRKQNTAPIGLDTPSVLFARPWVEGNLPSSPQAAAVLARPAPVTLIATPRTRAGYPAGTYDLAFAKVTAGGRLTLPSPATQFTLSVGQRFQVTLPEVGENELGVAIYLSEPQASGVGPLRLQEIVWFTRRRPKTRVMAGPYRYGLAVAAQNKTYLGTPPKPVVKRKRHAFDLQGATRATLTIGKLQSSLIVEAREWGTNGNNIRIELRKPATANQPLTVTVSGLNVIVDLATDAASAASSTASQVVSAIRGNDAASDLIRAYLPGNSEGRGLAPVLAATNLAGGTAAVTYLVKALYRTPFGESLASDTNTVTVETTEKGRSLEVRLRKVPAGVFEWVPLVYQSDGQWYAVYNPIRGAESAYGVNETARIFSYNPEGWPRDQRGTPVTSAVTQRDLPLADESGIPEPTSEPDPPVIYGASFLPPGKYFVQQALVAQDGRESLPSAPVSITLGAADMLLVSFPNDTNRIKNAEFTELASDGQPLHHTVVKNSGATAVLPGEIRLATASAIAQADTPYHETDWVAVDRTREYPVRGRMNVYSYTSGRADTTLREYDANGVYLQQQTLVSAAAQGAVPYETAIGPTATATRMAFHASTARVAIRTGMGATTNHLGVQVSNLAIHVPTTANMRKRTFPTEPGQPTDTDYRNFLQEPYPQFAQRGVEVPPPAEVLPAGLTPPSYVTIPGRDYPAVPAWQASKLTQAGDKVQPTTANAHGYIAQNAGTTGTTEPVWPTTAGATVVSGDVTFQETSSTLLDSDPDGTPVRQAYYFAPASQAIRSEMFFTHYRKAVQPGETRAFGVWMRYEKVTTNARPFYITLHKLGGERVEVGSVVGTGLGGLGTAPVSGAWTYYEKTFTVPTDCYEMRVTSRNIGGGVLVAQMPRSSAGTAKSGYGRASSGYLRATLDTETPKAPPFDFSMGNRWVRESLEFSELPSGTSGSGQFRSTDSDPLAEGFSESSWSPWQTDLLRVPQARWLDAYVTLTGNGRDTPILASGSPGVLKSQNFSVLLREDRSEFDAGVIVGDFPFYSAPPNDTVDAESDVVTVSEGKPRGRLAPFTVVARSEAAMREIEETWSRNAFCVEGGGKVAYFRFLEPVEFGVESATALKHEEKWYLMGTASVSSVRVSQMVEDVMLAGR